MKIIVNDDINMIIFLNKIYLNNKLVNKAHKNEVISIYSKEKVNIGDEVIKTSDKISLDSINKEINKHLYVYDYCYAILNK